MPDLFDRLFPEPNSGTDKIAVHVFHAALIDYAGGNTTRTQIIAGFNLDASATSDLDVLIAAVDALATRLDKIQFGVEFEAVAELAEAGLKYNTKAAFASRLGL